MSFLPAFIDEICVYLAANTASHFTYGTGEGNLKLGELVRGIEGTFAVAVPSEAPSMYSPLETHTIDFWSVNSNGAQAYDDLQYVYNLFHQRYLTQTPQFTTTSFQVYSAAAQGQIEDMDRDIEGRHLFRLTITFVTQNLIS